MLLTRRLVAYSIQSVNKRSAEYSTNVCQRLEQFITSLAS